MRLTDIGIFWQDLPPVRKGGMRERGPMPPIPATGWRPPPEFPNLSGAKIIGFDVEGWDPELRKAGPGWGRGKGHLIGASLSVEDGTSWYFPFGHGFEKKGDDWQQVLPPEEAAMNMDRNHVLGFLNHVLDTPHIPKTGANLIFDTGWLSWEGVNVTGPLYDVQFAEALLNSETPGVALDDLALRYLGIGKTTDTLYEWLASWCGGAVSGKQRANLYLSPPSLAGPYAESDASLPIAILSKQWPALVARGCLDLFKLECRLIPLLVKMRMKGAGVSVEKAEELYDQLGKDLLIPGEKMTEMVGKVVNPNATESLLSAFKKLGIAPPEVKDKKTGKMKVTFAAEPLEALNHPFADLVLEYRRTEKVRNTFVKGYIIDKNVNGRVHCSFHPLKGTANGARSGRLASSDPNLQNIPIRTEMGRRVRQAFVAQGIWRKWDYSQIEYRLLAHHAVGKGSNELRMKYQQNPHIDYHQLVGDLVLEITALELERRPIKTINFGLIYGMVEHTLARRLKLKPAEAKKLFAAYHKAAPFVKATMEAAEAEVHATGVITTLLGRRSDFTSWGPKDYVEGRPSRPSREAAAREWGFGNICRQFTHKAINRRLQGGAADIMKKAMVDCYEAGLFEEDACGMPMLTVHDELDFDDLHMEENRDCWKEFKWRMENAVPCRVPIVIDHSSGPSWGQAD